MIGRRLIDIAVAFSGLLVTAPLLAAILLLVWRQDGHWPFYVARRGGVRGVPFTMYKVRSMVVSADRNGVESTGAGDVRITPLGHFLRRWKIDELPQLWNVLRGDMSLVGPRPNTLGEIMRYDPVERTLLDVRPGITDIASIVFADEGEIIKDAVDPDQAYRELIWPWKSALGLLYVRHASAALNVRLIYLTLVAILDRPRALHAIGGLLGQLGADDRLRSVAARGQPLRPVSAGWP